MEKINFSAIVVTYNEDRRLIECLNSLKFCDQLLVVDLGSTDTSIDIAKKFRAQILHVQRMPVVEQIHAKVINQAKNDWVILLDPDEVMPVGIENVLQTHISNIPNLGLIKIPSQFYFKGKELLCTIWGKNDLSKRFVIHKLRNKLSVQVHCSITLLDGFTSVICQRGNNNYIKHYWTDSYNQLFEKHLRYIKKEGEAKYTKGERFSYYGLLTSTIIAFKYNIISCNGYRNFTGVFLSLFYSWYILMSKLSLKKYQKKLGYK